jgi:hypothetical protein
MFTAQTVYGAQPQMPSLGIAAPTQHMGTDDLRGGLRGLIDPNNPLFWAMAILATTFGLIGVAGSVRLGGAKVSVSADRS